MATLDRTRFTTREYAPYLAFWKQFLPAYASGFTFKVSPDCTQEQAFKDLVYDIPDACAQDILQRVNGSDSGVLVTLLGTLGIVLQRYTGGTSCIVHTPLCGPAVNEDELYADVVPVFLQANGGESFRTYLVRCQALMAELYSFQNFPLELIAGKKTPEPFRANVMLRYEGIHLAMQEKGRYDLIVTVERKENTLRLRIRYNRALYLDSVVAQMPAHWVEVLRFLHKPDTEIRQISFLTTDERSRILIDFNRTERSFTDQLTMAEVFREQVNKTPDAVAVVDAEVTLTYRALNEKANQVARYLRHSIGLRAGDIAAIATDKSASVVIAMLAILKAGAAFLPLDPRDPSQRKAYILEDSCASVLLTDTAFLFEYDTYRGKLVALDAELPLLEESDEDLASQCTADDKAYIIYTSGSTGVPKGVVIEHRSEVNMSLDQIIKFGIMPSDRILQLASLSFDASVSEIFMALYCGATLVMMDQQQVHERDTFVAGLKQKSVTVVTFPPALLSVIGPQYVAFLRVIITAGEAANVRDAIQASVSSAYYNAYGPTECAVCVSIHRVVPSQQLVETIPIGRPIANSKVYILDSRHEPVPVGIEGELYVAGTGVGRGYLNQPELTNETFMANPFGAGRLYKTGDRASWLPNGDLLYHGRIDHQMKIRGYRIEAGEIERRLLQHDPIVEAVVIAKPDALGEKQLVAYLSCSVDYQKPELDAFLQQFVPHYMIPSRYFILPKLPLTTNGKIDRQLLADLPNEEANKHKYHAPSNQLQRQLAEIWSETLRRDSISVRDNFFEIGGHSLKATQVLSRIYKEMHAKIELTSIFIHPTIESLAEVIASAKRVTYEPVEPTAIREHYDLAHAQKRLWIMDQFENGQNAYRIPVIYRFRGELDHDAFIKAFQALIERHENLRTVFITVNGEPQQKIQNFYAAEKALKFIDLKDVADQAAVIETLMRREAEQSFNLEQGPLYRATLLQSDESTFTFLFTMHHIIADGWSMNVLIREFWILYDACRANRPSPLAPLRIQYKDFVYWQKKIISDRDEKYWLNKLSGDLKSLALPCDQHKTSGSLYRGAKEALLLKPEQVRRLNHLALRNQTTLSGVIFTLYNILLHQITGQRDIIVGMGIANRSHPDLENLVGFFVNILIMRNAVSAEMDFEAILREVSQGMIEAFDHQNYPFDLLVEKLNPERITQHQPVTNVMYEFENFADVEIKVFPGKDLSPDGLDFETALIQQSSGAAKFDLTLIVNQQHEGLSLAFEYNADLFFPSTIRKWLNYFERFTTRVGEFA